jgi:hypothetical protein
MKRRTIHVCTLLLLCLPAASAEADGRGSSPKAERFACVFISEARVQALRDAVATKAEPTWSAFQALRAVADKNLSRTPTVPEHWYVPGFYRDAEGHRAAKNGLRDDANAAYALALCYRMTGEPRYAESAIRLIDAWASDLQTLSRQEDSTLSFSYHFPALILAADLLRRTAVWPPERREAFAEFLRTRALPMNTMDRQNNWGNWGLVLASACAVYLQDEALFEQCVERWKHFIEHQLADDGHLPHEVRRSAGQRGIWYSHFSLMPQTIAAEILKVNGVDLFDHVSPSGRTLKQAFDKIAAWTADPAAFPYWQGDPQQLLGVTYFSYFEILNPRWPNAAATALLEDSRPKTADHAAPFLTFTHGQ